MSTAFHDLRTAANQTSTVVAKALGVKLGTVWRWDNGERPRWRHMPALAQLCGVDLSEAVARIWGERIGDPCPCGCGAKKAEPNEPGALSLAFDLACAGCGKIRKYCRGWEHTHAKALCHDCAMAKRAKERIELTCVGYMIYNARQPRHAKTCRRIIKMLRSRLKYWSRHNRTIDDEQQRPFVNAAEGRYRCERCWYGFQSIKVREKKVREFLLKVNPYRSVATIKSLAQLRELQRRCFELSRPGLSYNPNLMNSKRTYKRGFRRSDTISQIKGSLAWRAKTSPNIVKGLCVVCDKIIFSYDTKGEAPPRAHQKCFADYQREHHDKQFKAISKTRRPGGQVSTENLAKHFSWAVRHHFGGISLRNLAKETGNITEGGIRKNIAHVMQYLPDPELVPPYFRQRITLLREAQNPPTEAENSA